MLCIIGPFSRSAACPYRIALVKGSPNHFAFELLLTSAFRCGLLWNHAGSQRSKYGYEVAEGP